MNTASVEKKRFYNRVRRTCKLHDIDINYDGVPKMIAGIELVKDGKVLCSDYANDSRPLNINWKRLHEELTEKGITGGIK
tara:strand:- start:423 stop:662 length:240 start_codon:yes stop_codon:yes gene_type:complete